MSKKIKRVRVARKLLGRLGAYIMSLGKPIGDSRPGAVAIFDFDYITATDIKVIGPLTRPSWQTQSTGQRIGSVVRQAGAAAV